MKALEAMLVIGILAAWGRGAGRQRACRAGGPGWQRAGPWRWHSAVMQGALGSLSDRGQEIFQALLILFAAALMTHMVLWMWRHARPAPRNGRAGTALPNTGAPGALPLSQPWPWREGAETVIFLQGMASGRAGGALLPSALAGLSLAAHRLGGGAGLRLLPQHQVLRVSAHLLLLFAAGMLVLGTDRLIGMEWIPPGPDLLWDTSAWLDDGAGAGKWLADLFATGPSCGRQCAGLLCVLVLMAAQHWWSVRPRRRLRHEHTHAAFSAAPGT